MKIYFARIFLFIALCTAFSCHMTKRRYMKGYYKHHSARTHQTTKPESEKNEPVTEKNEDQPDAAIHSANGVDTVQIVESPNQTPANKGLSNNQPVRGKTEKKKEEKPGENASSETQNLQPNYGNENSAPNEYKKDSRENTGIRDKEEEDMGFWDRLWDHLIPILLLLLPIAVAAFILLNFPLVLSTFAWAWFALSFIPAGLFPLVSEVSDSPTLLFLIGLAVSNLPIALAFFIQFVLSFNIGLMGIIGLIYIGLVIAIALGSLGFDPEVFMGVLTAGFYIGLIIGGPFCIVMGILGYGGPIVWAIAVLGVLSLVALIGLLSVGFSR